MRRAARKDRNHCEIRDGLREIPGVSVFDTGAIGDGFVDIVVGRNGINYLMEIKDGKKVKSKRKLTEDEEKFHATWKGSVHIVESFEDALRIINK